MKPIILTLSLLLTACNSFFYYPDQGYYTDPYKLPVRPQDIFFESSDGLKLHGWYFQHVPESPEKRTKPLAKILFFHGNAQNISTHFLQLYFLLENSMDFFIFDYRGYGRSQGTPSPLGTVRDGLAALNFISEKDPDVPVIVFAQSLGGAIALKTLIEAKKTNTLTKVKLAVIDSSFSNYKAVAADTLSKSWLTWLFQPLAWLIVDNSQKPEPELPSLAPLPILVIHGTEDRVVSFAMGQRLYEKLAEPKAFISINKGHHTDFLVRNSGQNRLAFAEILKKSIECGECFKNYMSKLK